MKRIFLLSTIAIFFAASSFAMPQAKHHKHHKHHKKAMAHHQKMKH